MATRSTRRACPASSTVPRSQHLRPSQREAKRSTVAAGASATPGGPWRAPTQRASALALQAPQRRGEAEPGLGPGGIRERLPGLAPAGYSPAEA